MKDQNKLKNELRRRRIIRVRGKVAGTDHCPRLAVFRSLKHLSIQAIDDTTGRTLISVYDREIKTKNKKNLAKELGLLMAKKLVDKKVNRAVLDRRYYKYHGLIKEVIDGTREGGIKI